MKERLVYLVMIREWENDEVKERIVFRIFSSLKKAVEELKFHAQLYNGTFSESKIKENCCVSYEREGKEFTMSITSQIMF